METIGASHSCEEARQSSRLIMSLRLVEYSRMRPQPVQVKLQVCSGSSCSTKANLGVRASLCLMMCLAIFAVSAKGNRIGFYEIGPAGYWSRKWKVQLRAVWRLAGPAPGREGKNWPAKRCQRR